MIENFSEHVFIVSLKFYVVSEIPKLKRLCEHMVGRILNASMKDLPFFLAVLLSLLESMQCTLFLLASS
jgi:hypothetical protein